MSFALSDAFVRPVPSSVVMAEASDLLAKSQQVSLWVPMMAYLG
jgi:hypothetical protein